MGPWCGIVLAMLAMLGITGTSHAQVSLFDDGFDSGGTCGWSKAVPSPVNCPPEFAGIALLTAIDDDELSVSWVPATDDQTPTSLIQYDVHVAQTPDFTPTPQTLLTSVVGTSQASLPGLIPNTTYHVLVLARDEAGAESFPRSYRSISTPAFPVIVNGSTPIVDAASLGLGTPIAVTSTSLVFARTAGAQAPQVGSILAGATSDGGYLRKVESRAITATQIIVYTSSASLSDAIRQIDISSNLTLFDVNGIASNQAAAAQAALTEPGLDVRRSQRADDSSYTRIAWRQPSPILIAEQVDYLPNSRSGHAKAIDLGQMKADVSLTYEPELQLSGSWSLFGGIESGEAVARGKLSLSATAEYDFNSAASVSSPAVTLFRRSWLAYYHLGPVPVLQRITLEAVIQASASASTEVKARASAYASSTAEFGVRYNPNTGQWDPVRSVSFDRGVTTNLSVKGEVQGQIKVIPKITVTAYETASATLSLESVISGHAAVENTSAPTCAPLQLTAFDLELGAECYTSVSFTVFNRQFNILGKTRVCGPLSYPLFGLPQLALSKSGTGTDADPLNLEAAVTDGTNNRFRSSSAMWEVEPVIGQLDVVGNDPPRARFVCGENGPHTFTVSGFGGLGELGRRCFQIDHQCETVECITGTWVDGFAYQWDLTQTGTAISGIVSNVSCGPTRNVAGSFDGTNITLIATGAPPDCCDWRYDGVINGCQSGSGTWVQIGGAAGCTGSGSWSMSKTTSGLANLPRPSENGPDSPVKDP